MKDRTENRRVVITGGAGFIGSHLADACVQRGWQVVVIDNLATGHYENIQHLVKAPQTGVDDGRERDLSRFEFIRGSVNDSALLDRVFAKTDYVFHQAAIPSVPRSVENPLVSHEANVNGTLNVLLAARDQGVSKVVFASSSSVYGDTPTLPKQEDMIPNPLSPYAVNKLTGEYYCRVFQRVYGLPTACLRYFNVYGPRQRPDSEYAAVIPKFIQSIRKGIAPVIYGDGEQSRDFTFIRDVVAANLLMAESPATGIFNIGRGERITLNRMVELMGDLLGRKDLKPVYQAERAGDIKHSLSDISRAHACGYQPEYSLAEGLKETIGSAQNGDQAE